MSSPSRELSPEVASAERADAAGRHTEAVDHLVAGVHKQDVEATTRLGKRLLIGDRAPYLPKEGANFIVEACEGGGAEAAALRSVLLAVGAGSRPDLPAALASLVTAAERGWPAARGQLLVLAGRDSEPHVPAGEGAWRRLAGNINIEDWRRPPPARDLNGNPLIRCFPDFVSAPVCAWLTQKAQGRLSRALVYEAVVRKTIAHPTRTNTAATFNLLETDLVCVLVQARMAACLEIPFRHFEALSVLHYDPGEQISEHFDFVDPNVPNHDQEIARQGQRIVTFLVYLNDDYTGGETEFPRVGVSHKGRRGEGLFFLNALRDGSADLRTLHAGRPPERGEKWIVSQFVRNRPVF